MATNQLPSGGSLTTAKSDCPLKKGKKPVPEVTVTPAIEPEYKVVLFDRGLAAHQGPKDTKHKASGTFVNLSLTQAPTSPKLKAAKVTLSADPADKIEVYDSAGLARKLDLATPIPIKKLTGSSPYKVWVKGVAKGKFDLKLKVEQPTGAGATWKTAAEAVSAMSVVELGLTVHQFDETDLDPLEVDLGDKQSDYHTALKDKVLPDQKALTDQNKVQLGRLLHVQDSKNAGRARVLLTKLTAADWADGTDDYDVVLQASQAADETKASTAFKAWDKEYEGTEKALPYKVKVSALKASEVELWIEGTAESSKVRDLRLDLGLDRTAGGAEHKQKRNGDWGLFTVVKIDEVKLDYTPPKNKASAWDEAKEQFFINLVTGDDGRKVKIKAKLTKKIKDVPLYFMLAPDVNNGKAANWGVDLPASWKWKDLDPSLMPKDRTDPKKVMHLMVKTDADGKAEKELFLSQIGGDKFTPGAYIEQDPHLAKYVEGHADLGKRKPKLATKKLNVWRKFWYQHVNFKGIATTSVAVAEPKMLAMKATMQVCTPIVMSRKDIDAISPRVVYPKYMIGYANDTSDGIVLGDGNAHKVTSKSKAEGDKPVKIPCVTCHAFWIRPSEDVPAGSDNSGAMTTAWELASTFFPQRLTMDEKCLKPPLQGGSLYVAGTWEAQDWDGTTSTNPRSGALVDADLSIGLDRGGGAGRYKVDVAKPAALVIAPTTFVRVVGLVVKAARSYTGTYFSAEKDVAVFINPDAHGFCNTIVHELGHAFHQVPTTLPTGVPAHPDKYSLNGSHCGDNGVATDKNNCVMFGVTTVGAAKAFCAICHPYMLVQDMSTLA